jgi:hypothetical protein
MSFNYQRFVSFGNIVRFYVTGSKKGATYEIESTVVNDEFRSVVVYYDPI